MNKERFMVTGKRKDDGETVTGYYCVADCMGLEGVVQTEHTIYAESEEGGAKYDVDPETVEPLAVKEKRDEYFGELVWRCPNCGASRYPKEPRGMFCGFCGQRLERRTE
jgi:rubrerythrin